MAGFKDKWVVSYKSKEEMSKVKKGGSQKSKGGKYL